jgi:predicted dehydrogenase
MKLSRHDGFAKSWTKAITESLISVNKQDVAFPLQIRRFVNVFRGSEGPICSGRGVLRAVALCEAVKEAMETGKSVDVAI